MIQVNVHGFQKVILPLTQTTRKILPTNFCEVCFTFSQRKKKSFIKKMYHKEILFLHESKVLFRLQMSAYFYYSCMFTSLFWNEKIICYMKNCSTNWLCNEMSYFFRIVLRPPRNQLHIQKCRERYIIWNRVFLFIIHLTMQPNNQITKQCNIPIARPFF